MTTDDTTTSITALIDELTEQLSYLPGRHPQDSQIASTLLLLLAAAQIQGHGTPGHLLPNTLERRGCNRQEAQAVALAMHGLALRLGAWLGRTKECERGNQ